MENNCCVNFSSYPVDVPQVVENYAKLARVWLESPYLESFYHVKPESRPMAGDANLTIPRATFKRLKCQSMAWYLKHVDLELGWEADNICIPNHTCGPPAAGRSTVDKTMGDDDYVEKMQHSLYMKKWHQQLTER